MSPDSLHASRRHLSPLDFILHPFHHHLLPLADDGTASSFAFTQPLRFRQHVSTRNSDHCGISGQKISPYASFLSLLRRPPLRVPLFVSTSTFLFLFHFHIIISIFYYYYLHYGSSGSLTNTCLITLIVSLYRAPH